MADDYFKNLPDFWDFRFADSHCAIGILATINFALGLCSAYVPYYEEFREGFQVGLPRGIKDGNSLHYDSIVSRIKFGDSSSGAWLMIVTATATAVALQYGTQWLANPKVNP